MPYTDDDLLNPEKQDELDLAALVAAESEPVAAPVGPQDGLARLAELIAARQAQPEGPGAAEREYLAQNKPQAGWKNVLGAVGSAIAESTGTSGAIDRFHKTQQMAEQRRKEGLEAARSIDMGRRPVDRSTAELGVMAGMSPEASAAMTQDSPGLKLLNSGMGQLGARYLQLSQQAQKAAADREAKGTLQEDRQQHQLSLEEKRLAGRKELKAMGKGAGAGGGGGVPAMTPEQRADGQVAVFAAQTNIPRDKIKAYLAGDQTALAGADLEKLQNAQGIWSQLGAKQKQDALKTAFAREGSNVDTVWRANETKMNDPKALLALKNEIDEKAADIKAARAAWANMSTGAKNAMAKYGGQGGTVAKMIRDMSMSEQDRAYAAELQNLANALIKAQSGAAVSEGEWGRLATRMGFAEKDFDVMNSPATISSWLDRMTRGVITLKQNATAVYKPLAGMWGQK